MLDANPAVCRYVLPEVLAKQVRGEVYRALCFIGKNDWIAALQLAYPAIDCHGSCLLEER